MAPTRPIRLPNGKYLVSLKDDTGQSFSVEMDPEEFEEHVSAQQRAAHRKALAIEGPRRPRMMSIADTSYEALKTIGGGNASGGIRRVLAYYLNVQRRAADRKALQEWRADPTTPSTAFSEPGGELYPPPHDNTTPEGAVERDLLSGGTLDPRDDSGALDIISQQEHDNA